MTPSEIEAVRHALAREWNPNHLIGFASTLAPEHASEASMLFARATLLERRVRGGYLEECLRTLDVARRTASSCDRHVDGANAWEAHEALKGASELVVAGSCPGASPLAHALVLEPMLGTGIRVVRAVAARLAPRVAHMTSPDERVARARWVRQLSCEQALTRGSPHP